VLASALILSWKATHNRWIWVFQEERAEKQEGGMIMATSFHPEEVAPARTPERVKQTGEMSTQHGSMERIARDGAAQPDRANS
jgi:hypothetical protein